MLKSTSSPSFVLSIRAPEICQECGCSCNNCSYNNSLDLHHEIEELRSNLNKCNAHMAQMESEFQESRDFADSQIDKLQDELAKLRDRYDRLLETYKKTQKVNHDLEDKVLTVVQKYEAEKAVLEKKLNDTNTQLQDAKYSISELEEECERYRNDCSIAVQLLQCKPSNFVAHKLNTLPLDLQQRVKCHLTKEEQISMDSSNAQPETKMIRVPMPTFPPTAMVYSVNRNTPEVHSTQSQTTQTNHGKCSSDNVPMNLITQVLAPGEAKRKPRKYRVCSRCRVGYALVDQAVQTVQSSYIDANGYPRTAVANMRTNPPTITPHYPGVHRPRTNSNDSDTMYQ